MSNEDEQNPAPPVPRDLVEGAAVVQELQDWLGVAAKSLPGSPPVVSLVWTIYTLEICLDNQCIWSDQESNRPPTLAKCLQALAPEARAWLTYGPAIDAFLAALPPEEEEGA